MSTLIWILVIVLVLYLMFRRSNNRQMPNEGMTQSQPHEEKVVHREEGMPEAEGTTPHKEIVVEETDDPKKDAA